jgi:cytochrome P450
MQVGRCCVEDLTLGGYHVEAGTTVLISPHVIHRDAAYWQAPDAFDPSRLMDHLGPAITLSPRN